MSRRKSWALLRLGLLWFVSGCGLPTTRPPVPDDAFFPHPADYRLGSHGSDAQAAPARCVRCHDAGVGRLVQGVVPSAPACASCHDYPHKPAWSVGSVHGAAWRTAPEPCQLCHGVDGTRAPGAGGRGACTSCHSTYPHPDAWEEGPLHGVAASIRGSEACTGCHGAGGAAIESSRPCAECHAPYPHPSGWAAPDVHGAAWVAAGDPDACAGACHGMDQPPGARCQRCHESFPHPEAWRGTHPGVVQKRGAGNCRSCHADRPPGPAIPGGCYTRCHAESPL